MARKKKVKRFRAVTAVKELARERVGAPPAGKIVVEKKKKPEKHKPTLRKLLDESEEPNATSLNLRRGYRYDSQSNSACRIRRARRIAS